MNDNGMAWSRTIRAKQGEGHCSVNGRNVGARTKHSGDNSMTTTAPSAATERWLAAAPFLPRPLDPDAVIADRLILLLHYGVDRSEHNWLSTRSGDYYWNQYLPERIQDAAYTSGGNLNRWWTKVSGHLGSTPRTRAQEIELAVLLATEHPKRVLQAMRDQTAALTLRTKIITDAVRADRTPADEVDR
jgi:hypothetical protein